MKHLSGLLTALMLVLLIGTAFAAGVLLPDAAEPDTPEEPETPQAAVSLFVENGLYGAKTNSGRILLEPEWYYLHLMGDHVLIARRSGSSTRCGLITAEGSQLTPFLYQGFEQIAPDVWIGLVGDESDLNVHLYHSSGKRWTDEAWDSCEAESGYLMLTRGRTICSVLPEQDRLTLQSWHSEHAVGLHALVMDLQTAALSDLPDADTLSHLGDAAAGYLTYLFISQDTPPDTALLSGDDPAQLTVSYLYDGCTLEKAKLLRIVPQETGGFPTYLLHMLVEYKKQDSSGHANMIRTAIYLTVSRNAAGAYTYSGFSDRLLEAVGEIQ